MHRAVHHHGRQGLRVEVVHQSSDQEYILLLGERQGLLLVQQQAEELLLPLVAPLAFVSRAPLRRHARCLQGEAGAWHLSLDPLKEWFEVRCHLHAAAADQTVVQQTQERCVEQPVLGALVLIAGVQAFQLFTLKGAISQGGARTTVSAQSGGGSGSPTLPGNLQELPGMVGGC